MYRANLLCLTDMPGFALEVYFIFFKKTQQRHVAMVLGSKNMLSSVPAAV